MLGFHLDLLIHVLLSPCQIIRCPVIWLVIPILIRSVETQEVTAADDLAQVINKLLILALVRERLDTGCLVVALLHLAQ